MSDEKSKISGWEAADRVAHGAGKAIDGVALVVIKLYGIGLLFAGILILVLTFATGWWAGLLLIAYGIYLLTPGSKFVVW